MSENPKPQFEVKNIPKTEEFPEVFEPKSEKQKDTAGLEDRDRDKLLEIRQSLGLEAQERKGWNVVLKPEKEWKKNEQETKTESLFDRLTIWSRSFSATERLARKDNEELIRELDKERLRLPQRSFDYKRGAGVEGMVGKDVGILAKGFFDCSGLVFQTKKGVAVVHISPNVFKDPSEGGESVEDRDVWGHTRSALKELLDREGESHTNRTIKANLNEAEIAELQEMIDSGDLRSTMLSGEGNIVPNEIAHSLGTLARSRNLPFMKTDIHCLDGIRLGEKGYAIYATPDSIYCVGSNGSILKNGKNFPPTMYEYK